MAAKKVGYQLVPRDSDPGIAIYAMLDQLIEKHHEHLTNARIAVAWNRTWQPDVDGRVTLGKCKKASDLDRELAPYDFVIMLWQEFYQDDDVTDAQRMALLDHELCHAEVQLDESGEPQRDDKGRTVYRIRKHDLEEFSEVVRRHGIWKGDVEAFAAALSQARATKGKTEEEIAEARKRAADISAAQEARDLTQRVREHEGEPDEATVARLAKNPKILAAIEKMRPKSGSVTITTHIDGKESAGVTLHADGRNERA